MSTKTLITADQLEQMPDDDSVQIELDEGELVTIAPAGLEHGDCGINIAYLLKDHVKKHGLGKVYSADTGFRLREDTALRTCPSSVKTGWRLSTGEDSARVVPTWLSRFSHPPTACGSSCGR